jgi:hypothetical protein
MAVAPLSQRSPGSPSRVAAAGSEVATTTGAPGSSVTRTPVRMVTPRARAWPARRSIIVPHPPGM